MFRTLLLWLRRKKANRSMSTDGLSPKPHLVNVRGRIIARDIPYLIPKDVEDANRLDFQHHMLRIALKGLYAAPLEVKKVESILDVAAGTGRWAIEMARMFPRSLVTGLDLIAPASDNSEQESYDPGARPANYSFVQGNMFHALPFADNSFDFVHMRLVYAAVLINKWASLIAELVRVTKPGGYVELVEGYIPIETGPHTAAIIAAILQTSAARNINLKLGENIGQMLANAGLAVISNHTVFISIGRRWGRLGMLCEKDMMSVFKGIGANVVASGVLSAETWNQHYAQIPAELSTMQTLWPVFQAYGKKPIPIKR